ncbi:MAG: helix-turn-helix transcriptional regulator [Proteobacteria bacterium]|nr:helix-turn-helix transcriptional regulator [Pseudomonadota bacterium]MBS0598863.1 helix-turn-helix transcriptional regulator [Pseudomonadota bacterium]
MDDVTALAALKALGQEHRLAAFRALVEAGPGGLSVGELRDQLDIPPATLTAHLNILRGAGLVLDQRQGRVIRVRADFERMNGLVGYLTENCCGGTADCGTATSCKPVKKGSRP